MNARSSARRAPLAALLALAAACGGGSSSNPGSGGNAGASTYALPAIATVSDFAPAGASAYLAIPGLGDDFGPLPGGAWVETPDGRASLVLVLARRDEPRARLALRLDLANRLAPGAPHYADRAVPRIGLDAAAYTSFGGPIDPATWTFYGLSSGELRGLDALAGAVLRLDPADDTGLQRGRGADNLGLGAGLSMALAATVIAQPSAGAPLAQDGTLTLAFALAERERTYAAGASADASLGGVAKPALVAPGLGGSFAVQADGSWHERADGTLEFEALLVRTDDPTQRWQVLLSASERVDGAVGDAPPPGNPWLELAAGAYRPSGPVDERAWRYYRVLDGHLSGRGKMRGAQARLASGSRALQVGFGASGMDGDLGAAALLELEIVAQSPHGPRLTWGSSAAELRLPLRRAWVGNVRTPAVDRDVSTHSGAALALPGLSTDLEVLAGGEFSETDAGVAELRAELVSASDPAETWFLELRLASRVDADEGAPPGSPVLALDPSAYAANGGAVQPGGWHYYTEATGRLRGLGARAGAELALGVGATAVQLGRGASGANTSAGLSGALTALLVSQPSAGGALLPDYAAALALDIERYSERCARAAAADPMVCPWPGGWALKLPGIANDLVLAPGAQFEERGDGTARLTGTLQRAADPARRMLVDLRFSGRRDPGEGPGAGGPNLQLAIEVYVFAGGPIDPAKWHFYEEWNGTLVGLEAWRGATLALGRAGTNFQIGHGASNKNLSYGASCGVLVTVLAQPEKDGVLAPAGTGELNVNLGDSCR